MTLSLLGLLTNGAAVVWLVQLAVIMLIFGKMSAPYYLHEPAGSSPRRECGRTNCWKRRWPHA
jgi:hypothetical protein